MIIAFYWRVRQKFGIDHPMKSLFFSFIWVPLIFFSLQGRGAADPTTVELSALLRPYQKSSGLKGEVNKSFYQAFRDKTEQSQGEIFLLKGRLKIRITEPKEQRSLLVINSKALWLETPFEEGFPVAVTKLSLKNVKKTEGIWNMFIGGAPLSKVFRITKKKVGDETEYMMIPKGEASYELVKAVMMFKGKDLLSLSYWDQMENKVSYHFENWKKEKMSLDQFEYTPPENSTVTNL